MKRLGMMIALLALAATSIGCVGRARIEPGYEGVLVHEYGNEKGVDVEALDVGKFWYNSISKSVYKFPVHIQRVVWTQDDREGSRNDESISFNSQEGAKMNVDVAIAIEFVAGSAPGVFTEYRRDANAILDGYVRDEVRNAFNTCGSTMKAVNVFGEGKAEFLNCANEIIVSELNPEWYHVDSINLISQFRVDTRVEQSINAVLEAAQRAIEAENKVRQAEAEAQQRIATAKGNAESVLLEAKAQAEANEILARSLTSTLVRYKAIDEWNGVLPHVTGSGAVPFIEVGGSK